MILVTVIAVALLLGFVFTVGAMLAATFGVTSAYPDFVVREDRITAGYKRLQAVIWLMCVTLGTFVTYMIAQGAHPVIVGLVLGLAFVAMLWRNSWEARERGLAHQILMTLVSVLGVAAGYELAKRVMGI